MEIQFVIIAFAPMGDRPMEINFNGKHVVSGFIISIIFSSIGLFLKALEILPLTWHVALSPVIVFVSVILCVIVFVIYCLAAHSMLGRK